MTLKEIASTIRNHVVDGLKGVTNEVFSVEQLMDEVVLEAGALIIQSVREGTLKIGNISQRIDGIELKCKDISNNCEIDAQVTAPHIQIPKLSQLVEVSEAIVYVGPMDNMTNFKVYSDIDYKYHKYNLVTSKRPYVWLDPSGTGDGNYNLYFFNLGKFDTLKFVSLSAFFENPYDLLSTPFANQFKLSEFYAPLLIQKQIIESMTQKYVNYYRQLNTPAQPNTQETQ